MNARVGVFRKSVSAISIILVGATLCLGQTKDLRLGTILIQTVSVGKTTSAGHMTPGIVVRLVNKATQSETFAISSDVGFAVVPARPGTYCYDAYSKDGTPLTMKRPAKDRCFDVEVAKDIEIGVEIVK